MAVSTHSRTKAAAFLLFVVPISALVSTHSRTKAAAVLIGAGLLQAFGFNTQPHEGGCSTDWAWLPDWSVSTHSRTKAAAG